MLQEAGDQVRFGYSTSCSRAYSSGFGGQGLGGQGSGFGVRVWGVRALGWGLVRGRVLDAGGHTLHACLIGGLNPKHPHPTPPWGPKPQTPSPYTPMGA